jgi:transposase
MLDYETFCQIRDHLTRQQLSVAQTARALALDVRTVAKWANVEQFRTRSGVARVGKLDAFKGQIVRWLDAHPYSAQQIFQRLREAGFDGGLTIVKDYVHRIRPRHQEAFLKLDFAPGEAAQVDWGEFGTIGVGATRRRLSFFLMVLCYSRRLYLEFTVSQTMEFFLSCHENAFAAFGGVPQKIMVDNLKSAVLQRLIGAAPVFNPKYLDFSRHWGFEIKPCNVRSGNEYGVVKNMSRWISNAPALPLKLTFLSRHNFRREGAKEGHQIGLVAPMLLSSRIAFYFTCRQRSRLCFQIDLGVDIGRRQRNVSKPAAYRVDVNSGLEKQRGSRVPNDVRMHVLASQ